jgi:Uma2 family endonuclease
MFANLPFKIELTRFGKLLMSPASNEHGRIQSRLCAQLLQQQQGGEVVTECSIATVDGVKVADVAWCSDDFVGRFGFMTPYPEAPELCIEILSPSNSTVEMDEKIQLYLNSGALEVWLVHNLDTIDYFSRDGRLQTSRLFPA